MKRILAILILLAAPVNADVPPIPQSDWDYVCEQVGNIYVTASCDNLARPQVVYTQLVKSVGWGGVAGAYQPGEQYVFVDPTGRHVKLTVRHEMTHYVLDMLNLLSTVDDRCRHEEVARFVAGQDSHEWRARYGCKKDEQ